MLVNIGIRLLAGKRVVAASRGRLNMSRGRGQWSVTETRRAAPLAARALLDYSCTMFWRLFLTYLLLVAAAVGLVGVLVLPAGGRPVLGPGPGRGRRRRR